MSRESTRPRLLLNDHDLHQLATLIANMVGDHLRTTASMEQLVPLEQEMNNDRQDYNTTSAADRVCLYSPVDHGTSTVSS